MIVVARVKQRAQQRSRRADHVRVLDDNLDDSDLLSLDVLARIEAYLDQHRDEYAFINISMGPLMRRNNAPILLPSIKYPTPMRITHNMKMPRRKYRK